MSRISTLAVRRVRGFTLVELLVVIAIIGVLIARSLPAVQAAREAARRQSMCQYLKQLGMGCHLHESALKHFPTGGWAFQWTGDPDKGFGPLQPGGWCYNVLPYIEQGTLREIGAGQTDLQKKTSLIIVKQQPIGTFICPSRRAVRTYPLPPPGSPYGGEQEISINVNTTTGFNKTDYAANAGDLVSITGLGPSTYAAGVPAAIPDATQTGVIFTHSKVKGSDIADGLSHTIMLGEKYLNPDQYENGCNGGDNNSMMNGSDTDNLRWVCNNVNDINHAPLQDTPGIGLGSFDPWTESFGSAHSGAAQFIFCDGSVQSIRYEVDIMTFHCLGHRNDGLQVKSSGF